MDMMTSGVGAGAGAAAAAMSQALNGATDQGAASAGFAQLLTTMMGTAQNSDASAMPYMLSGSWRDVNQGLMMNLLGQTVDNTEQVVTDPMLAMLMNLLQGDGEGMDVDQLLEQLKKRLQEIMEEQGGAMAAAQLMNLLRPEDMLAMTASVNEGTSEAAQQMLQTVLEAEPATLARILGVEGAAGSQPQQIFEAVAKPEAQPQQAAPQAEAAQPGTSVAPAAPQQAPPKAEQVMVEKGGEQAAQSQPNVQQAESDFQTAVWQARQMLQTGSTKPQQPKEQPNIDELQQRVDSGQFFQNTALAGMFRTEGMTTEEVPVPVPVATQLQDGILQGLAEGMERFSIKLVPEGLGEVTIRLTKSAEGMTLDIIARNADTQKLISMEAQALRDNLKPLQVEVDNILTTQQDALLSNQQNFERENSQQQELHGAAYYRDEPLGGVEEVVPEVAQVAPKTALDAYV